MNTETQGHPHAKLAQQFWAEMEQDDRAWKNWQSCSSRPEDTWQDCQEWPQFIESRKYRRKPRTININGHEVPEPCRVPLWGGQPYYTPFISIGEPGHLRGHWNHGDQDQRTLEAGIVHLTAEAAILHAKALLSLTCKPSPTL